MSDKIQLKVYISQKLLSKLWNYIKIAYPDSTYGALSIEVSNAIAHWLNEKGLVAHTKTRINPGIPKSQQRIDAIILFLRDLGFTNQFSYSAWERACTNLIGSDKRTVDKYLRLAEKIGRVKFYAGRTWEIV